MSPEQEAQKKAEEEKSKAEAEKAKSEDEIKKYLKDSDAVKELIAERDRYFGESRKYLNEINKFEKAKAEAEKAKKDAEDAALAEQGKYKELAEKQKAEAERAKAALDEAKVDFEIQVRALEAGAVDPDEIKVLIDRTGIKLAEDGKTVEGVSMAIEKLAKAKPHLFGVTSPNVGNDKKPLLGTPRNLEEKLTPQERITRGLTANAGKYVNRKT